jgi:hypothetical protein
MSIVCSTSNLNNIDKATPTNYQLVFPLIPTESSIASNNPFVMNIFSAVIPALNIGVNEKSWQSNKVKYDLNPLEFESWMVNFVVDSRLDNWELLFKWMSFINNNYDKIADYHKEYSVDAAMIITNNYGQAVMEIIFVDIWPSQLAEIGMSQREGEIVLEGMVTFEYDYFYVRSTAWTDEFSSSSSSISSSSSSSLSSSSSSRSSSSSLSSSSSSSSESSNVDRIAGLYMNDSEGTAAHTEVMHNAPLLIDDDTCTPAIASAANRSLLTNAQSFGFEFSEATAIPGFDLTCRVSGGSTPPTPPYDFINPHESYRLDAFRSSNNNNWTDYTFSGGGSFGWDGRYITPIVGSTSLLFKFRLPFDNTNSQPFLSAKYLKMRTIKSLMISGSNGELGQIIPTEVSIAEGQSSQDGVYAGTYRSKYKIFNYRRSFQTRLRELTNLYNQYSRFYNPPGKWYWEIKCDGYPPCTFNMRDARASKTLTQQGDTYSYGGSATGIPYNSGDILQFAVDVNAGYAWVGINNTWLNNADHPSAGNKPSERDVTIGNVKFYWNLRNYSDAFYTSQFKESQMTYPVPEGFQAAVKENYDDNMPSCSSSSSSESRSSSS